MNKNQTREEIRYIKEMIEKTRAITAGSWMFFLIWGIVAILGVAGMYLLVFVERYNLIWMNWIVFMGMGVAFSIVYGRRYEKFRGARTYSQNTTSHIGFACGIAFILVGFVFPLLKLYDWDLIAVLISVVAGMFVFSLAGVYEWNLLKLCGMIWWLGAVAMVFVHENYRALLLVPLILLGYIMPALVLRSRYYKQSDENVS